jgi:hypothetical protein
MLELIGIGVFDLHPVRHLEGAPLPKSDGILGEPSTVVIVNEVRSPS